MTWPEVQNDLTDVSSSTTISLTPASALLKWSMSVKEWNAGQPEMNLIAVSARLQVIASFWKNKINFEKNGTGNATAMSSASYSYIDYIANNSIRSDFAIRKTIIFTMPPILKPARRRDGDVTAPELPRTLTTPVPNQQKAKGTSSGGRVL